MTAFVDTVTFHQSNMKTCTMAVYVKLKPSGDVRIDVDLPPSFYKAIMDMAQTAADLHQSKMRAEIIGDRNDAS